MDMNAHAPLAKQSAYDRDFTEWLMSQADSLRDRKIDSLDWDNLAEEIESLGKSQYRELRSRITTILVHWIKLELSRSERARAGWRTTIRTRRLDLADHLEQSPSLRNQLQEAISTRYAAAAAVALGELEEHEPEMVASYRRSASALSEPEAAMLLEPERFPSTPT